MPEPIYLTPEGAERLQKELEDLKGPQRKALAKRLRDAIQMGDLSENADYHKAKEDQAFLEGRIQELDYILSKAEIKEDDGQRDEVRLGVKVTVQEKSEDDLFTETYVLVGAKEADSKNRKISYESPYGKALMGHKVGDKVDVETPGGKIRLKILKIE
jgi:transcription elongation factor GreA